MSKYCPQTDYWESLLLQSLKSLCLTSFIDVWQYDLHSVFLLAPASHRLAVSAGYLCVGLLSSPQFDHLTWWGSSHPFVSPLMRRQSGHWTTSALMTAKWALNCHDLRHSEKKSYFKKCDKLPLHSGNIFLNKWQEISVKLCFNACQKLENLHMLILDRASVCH